MSFQMDQYNSF